MTERGTDYYASKARSRSAALEELNTALADIAKYEQRSAAALVRLEEVQREARDERERSIAEAQLALEEALRRAEAIYGERIHAASSERGTAESLCAKARAAADAARERLLKLIPPAGADAAKEAGRRGFTLHASITKEGLLKEIARHGLRAVLQVPEGISEAEMVSKIESDPRECFVMDPSCDRRTEDGRCAGHDRDGLDA